MVIGSGLVRRNREGSRQYDRRNGQGGASNYEHAVGMILFLYTQKDQEQWGVCRLGMVFGPGSTRLDSIRKGGKSKGRRNGSERDGMREQEEGRTRRRANVFEGGE